MRDWLARLLPWRLQARSAAAPALHGGVSAAMSDAEAPPGYDAVTPVGFNARIGPIFRKAGADGAADHFLVPVREHHLNGAGTLHGGMLMALAGIALGAAASRAANAPCSVVSLNCDFVAAARAGDRVEGEARVSRRTRSVVFVSGELFMQAEGGARRTLLSATGIWKIEGGGEGT